MELKNDVLLDLAYLIEMSGGSAEFMLEIFDAFLEQTPGYMENLANAILAENWKAVAAFAHKIKPTFFYIGRADVRDYVQILENNAGALTNMEFIPATFQQLQTCVEQVYVQIAKAKLELKAQL